MPEHHVLNCFVQVHLPDDFLKFENSQTFNQMVLTGLAMV